MQNTAFWDSFLRQLSAWYMLSYERWELHSLKFWAILLQGVSVLEPTQKHCWGGHDISWHTESLSATNELKQHSCWQKFVFQQLAAEHLWQIWWWEAGLPGWLLSSKPILLSLACLWNARWTLHSTGLLLPCYLVKVAQECLWFVQTLVRTCTGQYGHGRSELAINNPMVSLLSSFLCRFEVLNISCLSQGCPFSISRRVCYVVHMAIGSC